MQKHTQARTTPIQNQEATNPKPISCNSSTYDNSEDTHKCKWVSPEKSNVYYLHEISNNALANKWNIRALYMIAQSTVMHFPTVPQSGTFRNPRESFQAGSLVECCEDDMWSEQWRCCSQPSDTDTQRVWMHVLKHHQITHHHKWITTRSTRPFAPLQHSTLIAPYWQKLEGW